MTLPKLLLFLTLPLYVLDQITKFWTVNHLHPPRWVDFGAQRELVTDQIPVIENVFHWVRVHNQGVAFGFGNNSNWAPVVFLIVPLIALTMIRIFWKKGLFAAPAAKVAVALLLCGIFGNLTDRLLQGFFLEELNTASFIQRLLGGYVVDFISVKLPIYGWWPSFNVADSCIFVAAFTLFISGLREEKKSKAA